MSQPQVGVVIPTRANGRGVREAVTSALSQTDVDVHVVVAVDGSPELATTEEGSWLSELQLPNRVVYLGVHGAPGPLRAVGATLVQCEFVAFLDDDDEFLPGKLILQLDHLEDPRVCLVASNASATLPDGDSRPYHLPTQPYRVALRDALKSNPFITSSVVTRSSTLRRVGGFARAEPLRYCDDYVTWLKLLTQGYGANLPDQLVRYRVASPDSLSSGDPQSGEQTRTTALAHLLAEAVEMNLPLSTGDRSLAARLKGGAR